MRTAQSGWNGMVLARRGAARAIAVTMVAGAVVASAAPAFAQATTQTSSTGQIYTSDYRSTEIVNYSYETRLTANIAFSTIIETSLFSYEPPTTATSQQQFADALATYFPAGTTVAVDGTSVEIVSWQTPILTDQYNDLIDSFIETRFYTETSTETTQQVTSGDGPDAEVPVGNRGECFTAGSNGPTNFGGSYGQFADCSDYTTVTVAPGTVNTHTHTTTIQTEIQEEVGNYDVREYYFYDVRPDQTRSTTTGTLAIDRQVEETRRVDADATRLRGRFDGRALFDQTLDGTIEDEAVQARIERLTRPRGHASGGGPVVLVWSGARAGGVTTTLAGRDEETTVAVETGTIVTQQTIVGESIGVLIGDLGTCTNAGTTGAGLGALPTCDGGTGYYILADGETLTNTHTAQVTETTTTITTTETWLTSTVYDFTATAVPIGRVHGAVQEALLQIGGVGAHQRKMIDGGAVIPADRQFGLWISARWDDRRTRSRGPDPGFQLDGEDVSGGGAVRLGETATLGLAVDHLSRDLRLDGAPETAELAMTGVSVALLADGGRLKGSLEAGVCGGHASTRHGTETIGGLSNARYDVGAIGVEGRAGPVIRTTGLALHPWIGLDWTRVRIDGFTEQGGIALAAPEQSESRLAGTFGFDAGWSREVAGGSRVSLTATLAGEHILDGRDVARVVALVDGGADRLAVASAHQPETIGKAGLGATFRTASGIGFGVDATRWFGDGLRGWNVGARASIAF